MIDPEGRLWAASRIVDFDQRRHFSVTYAPPIPVQYVEETEDTRMAQLRKHIDHLGDGVFGIRFSEPDGPITILTDREHDETKYVNNYPLSALDLTFPVKTIQLRNLTELDRLGPQVDLVSYPQAPCVVDTPLARTKVAFKYWSLENGMFRTWYELNSRSRLPRDHPHIVPFDSVVLDHHTGGILPGGTLHENNATTRRFRLEWLRQLLAVVDDLNYQYGMMHQDIAPRNLVIDEQDNLRIFDFNYSFMIEKHYTPERDDIKGVVFTLYEIVTLDEQFRELPHAQQDAEVVLQMKWEKHRDVKLDADLDVFRSVLNGWVAKRKKAKGFPKPKAKPPMAAVPTYSYEGKLRKLTDTKMESVRVVFRNDLVDMGQQYWNWERPASYNLGKALQRASEKGKRPSTELAVKRRE